MTHAVCEFSNNMTPTFQSGVFFFFFPRDLHAHIGVGDHLLEVF